MLQTINYGVVIPARNEEKYLEKTLSSLRNQTIKPRIIIVVDDSSRDRTAEIARRNHAYVVEIKRRSNATAVGTPYLAFVINKGLEILERMKDLDYVMISGAECLYPKDYVERIINRMRLENVVIASGIAYGEPASEFGVRGAGRIIDAKWFREIGFRYPLNHGYETWLILKALSQGRRVKVYRDVKFLLLRQTTMNVQKAYLYGKAMKALGYMALYTVGRALLLLLNGHVNEAKYLILGYFIGKAKRYNDITDFTKYIQIRNFISRFFKGLIAR